MNAMQQFSSDARVFCLIHKMDLVPEDSGERVSDHQSSFLPSDSPLQLFKSREAELSRIALPMKVTCFKTSIWDETLYLAWSSIVYSLIPNVVMLEQQLDRFCQVCEADEVVLFERATFLVISHASTKEHEDIHRFEKISNIIKQFKLSCT
jgi:Ras-related GTP-binding protein A/B